MRTFGIFFVAVVFSVAAGCGGGSSNPGTSKAGRSGSTGGQCPSSSSGQVCTGEDAYTSCLLAACGTQYKACFGNNYAKGDFTGGSCIDYMNCMLACPCDGSAAQTSCEGNCTASLTTTAGMTCMTCLTTLGTCVNGAGCAQPVCTTTGTNTNTSTTTSTGTSCAALSACCGRMADATMKAACQSAVSSAGGAEATCALVLPQLQTYCP